MCFDFQEREKVKWMVNSVITNSKEAVKCEENTGNNFLVSVSQFNKGEASTVCEKCGDPIQVDEGLYMCPCNHVSVSARKEYKDAMITVVHQDGNKQTLSFDDPSIFADVGSLECFTVKEYKILLTNKFNVNIDGSKLLKLSLAKDSKQ